MADYYRAADLIVCRAGASSLAEIAFFAKPAVFIPLKIAAENHQFHNAELALNVDSAKIIEEDTLTAESLASSIDEVLTDQAVCRKMSENMSGLCRKEVAQTLFKTVISSC